MTNQVLNEAREIRLHIVHNPQELRTIHVFGKDATVGQEFYRRVNSGEKWTELNDKVL